MAGKLQNYTELARHTTAQLTSSYQEWTAFLSTAGRMYKYPFPEQLLIYAQRPEATASAEYDFWNQRLRRYVRRNSEGIALIDYRNGRQALRYVFDISDTGSAANAPPPYLWQYREEHRDAVVNALEQRYGVPASADLEVQLERIANQLAETYWTEHQQDILGIVDGSYLEEYDSFNVGASFRHAAAVSIAYTLLSRCGLEPQEYFQHEDFLSIFDFNTPNTITALGNAVSQTSEQVLRQIEVTIRRYEREKLENLTRAEPEAAGSRTESEAQTEPERTTEHEQRPDIHPERGLSDPGPDAGRTAVPQPGEIREDAPEVSGGIPARDMGDDGGERDAVSAPAGDGGRGEREAGTDDAGTGEVSRGDRGTESVRPAAVGRTDEHLQGAGGGSDPDRTGLRIIQENEHGQFYLFPTEQEQIETIREAESVRQTPSAFGISQDEIDHVLRLASNTEDARKRIVTEFSKEKGPESNAAFLKTIYHDGYGIQTAAGRLSIWCSENGFHIARGREVEHIPSAQIVTWEDAAKRIGELLEQGSFATNVEIEESPGFERRELAERLWYTARDYSAESNYNFFPSIRAVSDGGFPEATERIANLLSNPSARAAILSEYRQFYSAWQTDYNLPRHSYLRQEDTLRKLEELSLPRREYQSEMADVPAVQSFITEDEINHTLSSEETRRSRIFTFFAESHTQNEKADFLKREYGTGGHSSGVSHNFHSWLDYSGKGLVFRKPGCEDVTLSWLNAAKRIDTLISKGRFLTPAELARYESNHLEQSVEPAMDRNTERDTPEEAPAPKREITPEDIDRAIQAWNGSIQSKQAVVRFMQVHARERATAEWLSMEYNARADMPFHIAVDGAEMDMPWPKVQRRIAQLIKANRFYTEQEQDRFDDVDPIAVREELEQREGSPFVQQVTEDAERIAQDQEQMVDAPGPETNETDASEWEYVERQKFLAGLGLTDEQFTIVRAMETSGFRYSPDDANPGLHENLVFRDATNNYPLTYETWEDVYAWIDTAELSAYPGLREQVQHILHPDVPTPDIIQPAPVTESPSPASLSEGPVGEADRDPLAPAYQLGDTVYLENTEYRIAEIGDSSVQLQDPTLLYPIFRSENKAQFEAALYQDARNEHITDYLSADLNNADNDLQDVLSWDGGLLELRDKEQVAVWFRAGESNTRIAQRLAETYAGQASSMMTQVGEAVNYSASANGISIELQENPGTRFSYLWQEITPVLRAMYQQERNGFFHEPVLREQTGLENAPIRDTGESGQTREETETDAPDEEQVSSPSPAATIYPGERTGLPYDLVIERIPPPEAELPVQAPVQSQPGNEPERIQCSPSTAENFRITDVHLGEGGPKAKFRANMDAIHTLKAIEAENRAATSEEQETLSKYVGWGGIPDAFDPEKQGWSAEYQELQAALTPEEYKAARASTLNAHYTTPTVIQAIYDAVGQMGFQNGNILEPSMGVGNFFGMLPESMKDSRFYGVELDSITGRIAKQLYPKANITIAGFETTNRRDFFDLAVGNVPFGQYQVDDRAYNKLGFSIHNYFFAKTLDQVRPGGVVAFVTSRYTLDSKDFAARKYLAQRADFLGAIRLPNNAFRANAGTDVVADIIFLQKRDTPLAREPEWVHLGENEDGFSINSYFLEHPEMVLGRQTSESTQYGHQDFTVVPVEGEDLADRLQDAIKHISGTYREAELPDVGESADSPATIPADPNIKNYSYAVVDGEVYFRENSVMVKQDLNETAKARIKGLVELRDSVNALIDLQMDEGTTDGELRQAQRELNERYDAFSAKYGLINDRANRLAFADDNSYYLLCSLEVLDENGKLERKADFFNKRTIRQRRSVTHVDTAVEALGVCIGERAHVDLQYMASLMGGQNYIPQIVEDLRGIIYKDPGTGPFDYAEGGEHWSSGWQTADEYLSGNVRRKLRQAERAAQEYPEFQENVEALKKAQPKDLDASEIEVRLGTTWIDPEYFRQFMYEVLDTPWHLQDYIQLHYSPLTSEWQITHKGAIGGNNVAAYSTYGTDRANAYKILEDSLNLRDVRIYDTVTDPDGKERRVFNAKETTLAAQKQQKLRDAFKDWIWKDPERRERLVKQYNEEMNSTRPREYDGSHIVFSGMNPEIQLREHQRNAIAHVIYGGNTLLAHEVGAGKTFEMVASAMESKRLGLCSKSMFVVPNHLVTIIGISVHMKNHKKYRK